ncbi:MAG: leucine-rich repeat protein, partial [Eubacterium sp.]|nr:leucine-rich repeat protein [Eubacterium sp.]
MKKKIISMIMSLLIITGAVLPIQKPISANAASQYETQTLLSEVSASDWMSAIRGETRLTEITIPGSHDSGAKAFEFPYSAAAFVSKTQDKTIPQQLDAGVRFLDIRLEGKGEGDNYEAFLTHGDATIVYQGSGHSTSGKYYLDYLIQNVMDWLASHPSETVLICMKRDKGNADITTPVYNYIHGRRSDGYYFYGSSYDYRDHWYLGGGNPTLDEVRGKMVLFNRYNSGAADGGVYIDWPDQGGKGSYESPCYKENYARNGYIQDHYEWSVNNKVNATQEMLNLPHEKGKWYVSFSSTTLGETVPNPEGHAGEINPKLKNLTFNYGKPAGIYLMDFATEDLCRLFIKNNEGVSNLVQGTDGNINYTINRSTKTITLSGSGLMNDYAYSNQVGPANFGENAPWGDQPAGALYSGQYNTDIIENIVIGSGITYIGAYAFGNFGKVKNITLPGSLTSIGHNSFEYCKSLQSFDIRNTNVSAISVEAFKECSSMTSFYTRSGVSTIGARAFQNDSNLRMYGDWDWYSYTYADANNIEYIGKYAVYPKAGNTARESVNPFAGKNLSNGVTISFSQYCNQDLNWNGAVLNFSSGKNNENRYFIIMANGAILFNDGVNGNLPGSAKCYFDINSSAQVNTIGKQWVDIDITISPSHILKYYANGVLKKEYDLNSIASSSYPNGYSGSNGVLSFLANSEINLYYGASYSIYPGMAGTADSYIDSASFYTSVLSDSDIPKTETAAVLEGAELYNTFDSLPSIHSGNISRLDGYKEHSGVLYMPENSCYGEYETAVNNVITSNTASVDKLSSIKVNYIGTEEITGWQTVSTNIKGQTATRNYTSSELSFSLDGYTAANALLKAPDMGYDLMDFDSYDEAYTAALEYINSAEQEYTTDSIGALESVMNSLEYAPINGISHGDYYENCQAQIDAERDAINYAISKLVPTSNFARLDLAYSGAQRFLSSLDGRLPIYTNSSIINLQTAMRHAKRLAELSDEEKSNYHSPNAQAEINALAIEVETAFANLVRNDGEIDYSAYQSLVETAEKLDLDAYDFEDGELDTILETLSFALVGDNVYFTDGNGEKITVRTIDDSGLDQTTVDSVSDYLLSTLNEHIRMYDVELAQGNAEIGFNGTGKNIPTADSNKFKATYNSTAVLTAENELTACYMEYVSSTAIRTKQYQGFGEKYSTKVLGNVKIYAVSKTDSNYEVLILREYGAENPNKAVQLLDYVDDSHFTLPSAPAIPYYTFDGYYIGGEKVEGTIEITRDTTIKAKYVPDSTKDCAVTVTDTNGNTIYSQT